MSTRSKPMLLAPVANKLKQKVNEPPTRCVSINKKEEKQKYSSEDRDRDRDKDENEDEFEYEEQTELDVETESQTEAIFTTVSKKRKCGTDVLNNIPSAQSLRQQRNKQFEDEKDKFTADLIRSFEYGMSKGSNSFVVCHDIQYRWQHAVVEKTFKSKGYEIVYKNVRDYNEDRTSAELYIPGCINTREPFNV